MVAHRDPRGSGSDSCTRLASERLVGTGLPYRVTVGSVDVPGRPAHTPGCQRCIEVLAHGLLLLHVMSRPMVVFEALKDLAWAERVDPPVSVSRPPFRQER